MHAIVSNVIKSLEKGGSFSPSDREKFAQTAREHGIVSNVIKSLEKGGSFSPSDREKFAQTAREHGIEGSVIGEVIDIAQAISLIYRHEDRLDRSDLAREEKKAVHAELLIKSMK
ncbi:hypothetical protein [Helicobacter pylori]|uniref:hypothetical protein n=1 Tax=Helicobacter pylori TaxID=210 RepID=UPI001FF5CC65|nr:hypothetical protein [Helicobacter pylori]MCK0502096.1 hypothetical protein [Helicobacter pylori]